MMAPTNPYQADSVTTAGPAQLVLMLFDRALLALERSTAAAEHGDRVAAIEVMNTELQRAQDILTELQVTLDRERGGEVARNLDALYEFCLHRLVVANTSKDVSGLGPVARTLQGLRDAWDEACCRVPAGAAAS